MDSENSTATPSNQPKNSNGTFTDSSKTRHNIVTFNLLVAPFSNSEALPEYDPKDLDPKVRIERIQSKFLPHVQSQSIICMQEMCQSFLPKLQLFFTKHLYVLFYRLYGWSGNDFMGVGIAIPAGKYELLDIDYQNPCTDKKWIATPKPATFLETVGSFITRPIAWAIGARLPPRPIEPWQWVKAGRRNNIQISLKLKNRNTTAKPFFISTYHMPCMWQCPTTMLTLSSLCLQHLQKIADGFEYVFCGDFNFDPDSPSYKNYTQGLFDNALFNIVPNDPWRPQVQPVKSAHFELLNKEPDYTTLVKHKKVGSPDSAEDFKGAIDYFWISPGVSVQKVEIDCHSIPTREHYLPNKDNPSDHLLLSCQVLL